MIQEPHGSQRERLVLKMTEMGQILNLISTCLVSLLTFKINYNKGGGALLILIIVMDNI